MHTNEAFLDRLSICDRGFEVVELVKGGVGGVWCIVVGVEVGK